MLAALLILASCSYKNSAHKEVYSSIPSYKVSKNVDDTWKKTLAFFSSNNIRVVHAEKSSEYIITAPVIVQCGKQADAEADVVIENADQTPSNVTARYKVKITQVDGSTAIIPTLEDIHTGDECLIAKSTGKREKLLSAYVNE